MKAFLLFLFLDLIVLTNESPDYFSPNSFLNAYLEPLQTERTPREYSRVRIKLFFDKSIPNNHVYKNWTKIATDFFSSSLKVKPVNSRIFIERNCNSKKVHNIREHTNEKFETYCDGKCSRVTYCRTIPVPEEHLNQCKHCSTVSSCRKEQNKGSGVEDADLILYVGSFRKGLCKHSKVMAYASWCAKEGTLDRPIAGGINICPSTMQADLKVKRFVEIIIHEVMHILGFSKSLYGYFRDQNGIPLTERNQFGKPTGQPNKLKFDVSENVIRFVQRDWHVRGNQLLKKVAALIVTPKVVQEVRAHFNCPTLEGAELEDSAESFGHWEARIFQGEIMEAETEINTVFSRINFALLEDTGWYQANYSYAEPLEFGKNLGCDFCTRSCKYWMDTRNDPSPYCNKKEGFFCTLNRMALGKCKLIKYDVQLDSLYQYLDHIKGVPDNETGFYGGEESADYCPLINRFTWLDSAKGSECINESNIPNFDENFALESYGKNALCFESKTDWELVQYPGTCMTQYVISTKVLRKTGCYKYSCENGWLHIYVQERKYTCYQKKQIIEVQILEPLTMKLHKGTIICPLCEDICKNNARCNPDNSHRAQQYKYEKDQCIENVVNKPTTTPRLKPTRKTDWIPFWVTKAYSSLTQQLSTQSRRTWPTTTETTTTHSTTASSISVSVSEPTLPWTLLSIIGLIALSLIFSAIAYFLFQSERTKKSKAKKQRHRSRSRSERKARRKMTKGKDLSGGETRKERGVDTREDNTLEIN